MTLIEAIKSEKPFKRPCHDRWMKEADSSELRHVNEPEAVHLRDSDGKVISLMVDDLMAEDWVVQEASVTITRSQFWYALSRALKLAEDAQTLYRVGRKSSDPVVATLLAQELGLEPKP